MGLVTPTFIFVPGTTADATQVNADLAAIVFELNGNINADNALTDSGPVSVGRRLLTGSSLSLALADHEHTVNGNEPLPADPSTNNFVGREYFNTVTLEKRLCIDATGSGTWLTSGNPTAAELVVHAAQHKDGGHDPLPDNILTDHMKASRTIASATLGADVPISGSVYTLIQDLAVTTTGLQTLAVWVTLRFSNSTGTARNAAFRVQDHTAADITIYKSDAIQIQPNGVQTQISGFFYYTFPVAGGARTLRVQAGSAAAGTSVLASTTLNGESATTPTIQAVIV